jgi:hypothetical protein
MHVFFRIVLSAICCIALAGAVNAAEIEVVDLDAPLLGAEWDRRTEHDCHFRLTGPIENGDLEKLKKIEPLEGNNYLPRGRILCLDSPGGSFAEAIRFIDYFQEAVRGTWIEAGNRCESACALIFMAGSIFEFEAGEYPWRRMHPTAKLGFHSPDLTVGEGNYDAGTVKQAYAIALKTMSDATRLLLNKRDFDGLAWVQPSILLTMVSTPPDQMFYVDTIDLAGRWSIDVFPPVSAVAIDQQSLSIACSNMLAWTIDRLSMIQNHGSFTVDGFSITNVNNQFGPAWNVETVGMNPSGCKLSPDGLRVTSTQTIFVDTTGGDSGGGLPYRMKNFHMLHPATKLADLANLASAPASTARPSGAMTCIVVSSGAITDRDPCSKEIRNDPRKGQVTDYIWPSGGKTVMVVNGNSREINGKRGVKVEAPAGEIADCTLNTATGNIFCVAPGL